MSLRRRLIGLLGVLLVAGVNLGWSPQTVRHVSWYAVDFFPPDLERHVRRNHRRFDAGIRRGLAAPPTWRAGAPGSLSKALQAQIERCESGLKKPVPLEDLVEELGVLSVLVLDSNDPLAVAHEDPREPQYSRAYEKYVDTILGRVRLVYYGYDRNLVVDKNPESTVRQALDRSGELYPFVGNEFFRTGSLRDWRSFDDRSIAFGVAAVSLSRAMTDLANIGVFVWLQGGGVAPEPQPTPAGHSGPTIVVALEGGFPENSKERRGAPVIPSGGIVLPPP